MKNRKNSAIQPPMFFSILFLLNVINAQESPTITLPVEIRVYSEHFWNLSYDNHSSHDLRQQRTSQVVVPVQLTKISLGSEQARFEISPPIHLSVFNDKGSQAMMESITRTLSLSITPEDWNHLQNLENQKYLIFDQNSETHLGSFSEDIAQNNMDSYLKQSANDPYPLELRLFKKIIIHVSLEKLNSKNDISIHQIYIDSSLVLSPHEV